MDIWKIVSFLPIGGILVWLGNKIKNKFFPLGIKVDNENLNFVSARGTLRSLHSVEFYMNINFANRTSSNFNVLFSNINFYPKEKISNLKFSFDQKIHPTKSRRNYGDISVNPGNQLGYFYIKMEINKGMDVEDIKKYRYIPMVLELEYEISSNFNKRPFKKIIKNFFDVLYININQWI